MAMPGTLLLFPGAGSGRDQSTLVAVERAVAPAWTTVRADFAYRKEGRAGPTGRPSCSPWHSASELATIGPRVVVGGRSMGGRMCSMVAAGADGEPVPAKSPAWSLISYPLHPPAAAGQPPRRAPARSGAVPVRPRTRDPFGSPAELEDWTATIPGAVTHHWIEDRGHDLKGADAEVAAPSPPG